MQIILFSIELNHFLIIFETYYKGSNFFQMTLNSGSRPFLSRRPLKEQNIVQRPLKKIIVYARKVHN